MVVNFFYNKVLLRLRGFLHAFHLVEMTIPPKKTVISSEVERSPNLWYEQEYTRKPYFFITATKFALADFISSFKERFHPQSGFHPSRTDFVAQPCFALGEFGHKKSKLFDDQLSAPKLSCF